MGCQSTNKRAEIENFAAFVHGIQAACYGLAIPFHIKRKSWGLVLLQGILAAYHVKSTFGHLYDE